MLAKSLKLRGSGSADSMDRPSLGYVFDGGDVRTAYATEIAHSVSQRRGKRNAETTKNHGVLDFDLYGYATTNKTAGQNRYRGNATARHFPPANEGWGFAQRSKQPVAETSAGGGRRRWV